MHWVYTLISDAGRREREKDKVRRAVRNCGYPEWALKEGGRTEGKEREEGGGGSGQT